MSERSLPAYTVRVSAKARHVRLVVNPREGLVVVVPKRWRGDVAAIVASKRLWAERALSKVAESVALHAAGAEALLPNRIELRATGETLAVLYDSLPPAPASKSGARVLRKGDALRVTGGMSADERLSALARWLDREARRVLPQRASELAAAHGFAPARLRVSRARSRWGSCSSKGTVSLNRSLLFLPPRLVDALILHELAHLRVLDHSPAFWRTLAALDPDARRHRTELRTAVALIPPWADR